MSILAYIKSMVNLDSFLKIKYKGFEVKNTDFLSSERCVTSLDHKQDTKID